MHEVTQLSGCDWGATRVPPKKMSATLVAPDAHRRLKLSITKDSVSHVAAILLSVKKKDFLCLRIALSGLMLKNEFLTNQTYSVRTEFHHITYWLEMV